MLSNICKALCIVHPLHCRAVPNMGPNVPDGFKSSNELNMNIVFRAIVHLDRWEWNENSEIYIRFGDPRFGNWEYDAGPGRKIRYNLDMCFCILHMYSILMILDLVHCTLTEKLEMVITFSSLSWK